MTSFASLAVSYLASLAVFLMIDVIWIKRVMGPLFRRHIGDMMLDDPRVGAAAAFYVLYVAGIVYLAVLPGVQGGGLGTTALNGAVLGGLAYGTYEVTNYATLRNWTTRMLWIDVTWGVLLTMLTAIAGFLAHQAVAG